MDLEIYPKRIVKPLVELEKAGDLAAEHKLALDLGETLLTHITGIIFGEYKRNWDIDKKLEAELYRNGNKKPSFGVFLGLLRLLIKANGKSICDKYFEKGRSYPAVSDFVFNYNLLKSEVVNKGHDSDFVDALEPLKKGKTVAAKSGVEFFDSFVAVRNTYAHPEEKAKNPLRNWPLGDEYYELINPLMKDALTELISGFTVLGTHRPVLVKELDDRQHKGRFIEEIGDKEKELNLDLSDDDLNFVNTDVRYLLDKDNNLFSRFYQSEVPQINPSVAQTIIEEEKAKMIQPILLDMIRQKLEDGVIDEMEYLVLKDTAFSSFISEEKLKGLIEKVKSEKGITGEIFIKTKKADAHPMLNPYWLVHFSGLKGGKVEQSDDCLNTTNLHKNIWKQINAYIKHLIENHLDNEYVKWKVKPNQYQIGNLAYTYWGQIYPEHSPFENGFSIGFIVSKSFTWVKPKKSDPIRDQLRQPCILLYTTLNNKYLDDVDYHQKLQKKYGNINKELLVREREALEQIGGFIADWTVKPARVETIKDYFLQKDDSERDENIWVYSKVWNTADFMENNVFVPQIIAQIEKEIITYLVLFSNAVLTINDYALSNGFNAEHMKNLRDKATRSQKLLISEINEKINEDAFNIKEFAQNRGTELNLRKDRIAKVFKNFNFEENTKKSET
jgi:hypothetical protein